LPESPCEAYRREGFVSPIRVLRPEDADALAAEVDALALVSGIRPVRLPFTHAYFRWAWGLATHPALLDIVESIVGPDILCWGTLILAKPAGSPGVVSWHQDSAYTRFLDGVPALSAWIALTPATRDSGCLRVIPGSGGARLPFTADKDPNDILIRNIRVAAPVDEAAAVDLELQPGEASLHELSLIHGSGANRSTQARTGFIVRYATPAMRQPPYPVYRIRGSAGDIRCAEPPPFDATLDDYLAYLRSEVN